MRERPTACSRFYDHTARLELQLEDDHGDVSAVEDLGPVGQALGPELRGGVEGIAISTGQLHFCTIFNTNQIHSFQRPILGLVNVLYLHPFLAEDGLLHGDRVDGVEVDVQDDQVIQFNDILELKESHPVFISNLKENHEDQIRLSPSAQYSALFSLVQIS